MTCVKYMEIKRITRSDCAPFILGIHYAKRWPSISYAFGLFEGAELIGIVTYGTPPSAPLKRGIAGDEYKHQVLELNRLCLKYNRKKRSIKVGGGKPQAATGVNSGQFCGH